MENVILYSTNCPKCNVLKKKLDDAKIKYDIVTDVDEIIKLGFVSAPILKVGEKLMTFMDALQWINNR